MIFHKYCATGNDFIIIDNCLNKEEIIKICHRNFGVGADGLISVLINKDYIMMRIFNMDGSEAKMCGNGLRAVGRYLKDIHQIKNCEIEILTLSGPVLINNIDEEIALMMKFPYFEEKINEYCIYNAGNRHALKIVKKIDQEVLIKEAKIQRLQGYNITHIKVINKHKVEILTHENGVGITLSCGSASASTFAFLKDENHNLKSLDIESIGGMIRISDVKNMVMLTSEVELIFKGEWH